MRLLALGLVLVAACQSASAPRPTSVKADEPTAPASEQVALPVAELVGKPIASIEVVGLERGDSKAARRQIETRIGAAVDRAQLAADAERLWQSGQLEDVRVEGRLSDAGARIRFVCRERPLVAGVEVVSTMPREKLAKVMALRSGMALSWERLEATRAGILGLYDAEGVSDSTIDIRIEKRDNNQVQLFLTVVPGARRSLGALRFVGNKALSDAELLQVVQAKSGDVVHQDLIERWALLITALYYDHGYINAKVETSFDRKANDVTFTMVENEQFRLGTIEIRGKLARPRAQYMKLVKSKPGRVFNRSLVVADIEALDAFHKGLGFPNAVIEPNTNVDLDKLTVDVEFVIGE